MQAASIKFHDALEKFNILQKPTNEMNKYLREHPRLYKAAMIANHLFRTISMAAFMLISPLPALANFVLCLGGSLFYRLTVETHCAYKFALPAFAGSIAFLIGKSALVSLVTGAAFASLSAFALAVISLLPLCAYVTYIVLTVNYDVDRRLA